MLAERGPSQTVMTKDEKLAAGAKMHTKNGDDGMVDQCYLPPAIANPGNVIKVNVGGGLMGDSRSHENEAPFPEDLAEFFVRSLCPPDGLACDIFSGSGTTAAVAIKTGRRFIGCDIRQSQVDLTKRRIAEVQTELFA
jgi:DNA modification methylase